MKRSRLFSRPSAFAAAVFLLACAAAQAQPSRVVDIPTRPGVTQRFIYVAPDKPKAAAVLFAGGADGVVLTSTVMAQSRNMRETTVTDMALGRIAVPVLVVHHRQDGCRVCPFAEIPRLMSKLTAAPRKEFIAVDGGENEGDPCEAFAYHGYNGIEREVVAKIAGWVVKP